MPTEKIRSFILRNFYVIDPSTLDDSASLRDSGIVDSTGVLELISFIETEFGIKVADADLIPANLDSVERIGAYVERKLG